MVAGMGGAAADGPFVRDLWPIIHGPATRWSAPGRKNQLHPVFG